MMMLIYIEYMTSNTQMTTDKYLTTNELCDLFKVGPKTVWLWTEKGLNKYKAPGGRSGAVRYKLSEVEQFLRTQSGEGNEEK